MLIILVVCCVGLAARAKGAAECEQVEGAILLTVSSTRNGTGHRGVKVDIMHQYFNGPDGDAGLDLKHTWGRCGETKYVRLEAASFTTSSTAATRIPEGYEYFPGAGYYKLYISPMKNWTEAQEMCRADGGHLIVINSQAEVDVVKNFYSRAIPLLNTRGVWAGFHDQSKPGLYVTVSGKTLDNAGYAKWASGQPVSTKHCGFTFKQGMLHTWQCEEPAPFLCEQQH